MDGSIPFWLRRMDQLATTDLDSDLRGVVNFKLRIAKDVVDALRFALMERGPIVISDVLAIKSKSPPNSNMTSANQAEKLISINASHMSQALLLSDMFSELARKLALRDDKIDWLRACKYHILCCGTSGMNVPLLMTNISHVINIDEQHLLWSEFENFQPVRVLDTISSLCSKLGKAQEASKVARGALMHSYRAGLLKSLPKSMVKRLVMRMVDSSDPMIAADLFYAMHNFRYFESIFKETYSIIKSRQNDPNEDEERAQVHKYWLTVSPLE
jgi:hypothetical protein